MNLPPGIGQIETNVPFDSLTILQTRMRDQQSTGLIQAWLGDSRQIVSVFERGVSAGTYILDGDTSRLIQHTDLPTVWEGPCKAIQTVNSTGRFGRMVWLSLESTLQSRSDVREEAEWKQQVREWERIKFTGLAEVVGKNGAGYLTFTNGQLLEREAAFIGNLSADTLFANLPLRLTTFIPVTESNAWQCFALRQSGLKWGNGILSRFGNVAGVKFAQAVCREVTSQIQPWGWQITLNNGTIHDEHFFPRVAAATHAYRAIFMSMGAQMDFVIGNTFAQRILSEMFYELDSDERTTLSSHRLIPAAFSN